MFALIAKIIVDYFHGYGDDLREVLKKEKINVQMNDKLKAILDKLNPGYGRVLRMALENEGIEVQDKLLDKLNDIYVGFIPTPPALPPREQKPRPRSDDQEGEQQKGSASSRTILILASNPSNTERLRLDEEVKKIEQGLERARSGTSSRWSRSGP